MNYHPPSLDLAGTYRDACLAELRALKPGNVHVFADVGETKVADFEASAVASAPWIGQPRASVGARILGAIRATREAIGWNTNLGIVLLCAPLAAAAEAGGDLRAALASILSGLDRIDARDAFEAIRLASPGGLGSADRHDVHEAPTVTLREAMAEAAARDRIARAYLTDFEDVFETGLPALRQAQGGGLDEPWCTTSVHMAFLSRFADTHIERRRGRKQAEAVRARAAEIIGAGPPGPASLATLLAFDAELKKGDLNPGTSADFTVATLFAAAIMRSPATGS
ncbi:triphosphoribosyl-dephospho-CoA synthase [Labrys sp. ZIDIC5]|uniref:triphosphoribosyl-dephospho-CoA synthase n=1 Tax=Labrys sedimenti TaxID=3106036 RepID=UPI002ACAD25A|nr:triphosphoribosyl-dephospho-CoA synthase [Labrys sp. ZIDIC5]MDZ5452283.1 triphosphoribosyl-dephospho-CoA synthase [Labrys sp. ZIDIC5]